jgi:hypothetical protein
LAKEGSGSYLQCNTEFTAAFEPHFYSASARLNASGRREDLMTQALARIEKTGLVRYDAMQHAIVAARAVDEVKDIRDKAMALEKYAQQARNFDAEKRAAEIRITAETKGGQLLKAMSAEGKRHKRGGDRKSNSRDTSLKKISDLKLSDDQSARWQKLAENPKAVEKYLREETDVPTTAGALAAVAPKQKQKKWEPDFTEAAMLVCGAVRSLFEAKINPSAIANGCNARMRSTLRDHLEKVIPLLTEIKGEL